MREPPTTSMLETVIAKEMPMVNQFVHRLHSELFLLDYDEYVSFLFCFYVCQSNYWFMFMSYHVWLRVDNGVKECVHSCVCVHNLLAAYTVLYAYLHYIHLCGGQWVCVCDCMYVTAGVRERERSHWYCAVTLLHYHDYVFTLLCIECFIYDSWYWWWDNFPSFFPPFISEAVACIQKAIEIYTDMVRKNTLSLLQTPTLAFWHSSSKLCYSWLCY